MRRLNEDLRDLLAVASVEGEVFTAQVVAQVQGLPERDVLRALSSELGTRHRLVHEAGEDQVAAAGRFLSRFQFGHALFQTYLYGRLSPGERRLLHGEVGAALEALYGDQSASIAVPLAYHYTQAGEREKAAEYLTHAGDQARVAYAFEEAEAHYQQALELLASLSPIEKLKPARSRLLALKGLGLVHFASGHGADAEAYLREAIGLGQELGVASRELVRMYFWLGEVLFWQGRLDERLRIGEEGLALLADAGSSADGLAAAESAEAALMLQLIAGTHGMKGGWDTFRELAHRMAQLVQPLPYTEELRPVYAAIVMAHWEDKDPGEMTKWLRILEQQALERHDLTALAESRLLANSSDRGDLRGDMQDFRHALAILTKTGDRRYEGVCCAAIAEDLYFLGELEGAEVYARRALGIAEASGFKLVQARALRVIGRVALCHSALNEALEACQRALDFLLQADHLPWRKDVINTLGRAHLAQGDRENAMRRFREAITVPSGYGFFGTHTPVLSGLEEAYADPGAFRAFCRRFRETHPQASDLPTVQWFLEPANVAAVRDSSLQHDPFAESTLPDSILSSEWTWHDLYDDCSFRVVSDNRLEIYAANGRDLWKVNLSAPRLLRNGPENTAWVVQTICSRATADRPAIGGLLLWRDQENYLRLDWGTAGEREISFQGCVGNQDLIIGRGRLQMGKWANGQMGKSVDGQMGKSSGRVFLRLERAGDQLGALCSVDGETWFTVGHVKFPLEDPLQVGLHAIGNIDRTIYHGAYPEGTAIRFESFTLWGLER